MSIPTVPELKAQAKAVRAICADRGIALTHSAALEALARQYGFRDWNAASAGAPVSRDDVGGTVFSTEKMMGLLRGQISFPDVTGRVRAGEISVEDALRDLSRSVAEISRSRTWMTPEEGWADLVALSEAATSLRSNPDWKRSEGYTAWLAEADAFLTKMLDWADDSLAVALSTMATLTYRLPFHLGRMPTLLPFRNKYEAWLRDPARSRAAVEENFPGHTKAWTEADARNRAEVERVLNDPGLTDEEADAEGDTRNREIMRMEERLERIQAEALDAQEKGDIDAYESLMADHVELEGQIERAHADDEYEEE